MAGYFFNAMTLPRAAVFVDGQNLYYSAKAAFGYKVPNYDIRKLAQTICDRQDWHLQMVKFYTGYPNVEESPKLHRFWQSRLRVMQRDGVKVFSRVLRNGKEKGVDVRIALDVTRTVYANDCDVVVIVSRDQDFSEVADEVKYIARREGREITIASAYPRGTDKSVRGIDRTKWLPMDKQLYDSCIDERDYFKRKR